ncbi:unnamed protein product [Dibothriocephalus latus]|uniref:Uncharacterized protein n=1 Tax=Dibothriocephalus latus TaxID=60516 RepID=A0A3P7QW93_DIBLA|nr:unnamed protein product [Dibothriocephalus latus]
MTDVDSPLLFLAAICDVAIGTHAEAVTLPCQAVNQGSDQEAKATIRNQTKITMIMLLCTQSSSPKTLITLAPRGSFLSQFLRLDNKPNLLLLGRLIVIAVPAMVRASSSCADAALRILALKISVSQGPIRPPTYHVTVSLAPTSCSTCATCMTPAGIYHCALKSVAL